MAELKDVIAYLLAKYPHKSELSNARVTKMVYLADWLNAIRTGKQMTPIAWYFDNYGPFVWDVKKLVDEHPDIFESQATANYYGGRKTLLSLKDETFKPQVQAEEQAVLDHVIRQTQPLHWDDFIKLVYSTHPIVTSPRYTSLDLSAKSTEYKAQQRATSKS